MLHSNYEVIRETYYRYKGKWLVEWVWSRVCMHAHYECQANENVCDTYSMMCRQAWLTGSAADPHRRPAGPCAMCPVQFVRIRQDGLVLLLRT